MIGLPRLLDRIKYVVPARVVDLHVWIDFGEERNRDTLEDTMKFQHVFVVYNRSYNRAAYILTLTWMF